MTFFKVDKIIDWRPQWMVEKGEGIVLPEEENIVTAATPMDAILLVYPHIQIDGDDVNNDYVSTSAREDIYAYEVLLCKECKEYEPLDRFSGNDLICDICRDDVLSA